MKTTLEIHGHRGCRGHYPENTINGFLKAIELGAKVIEMDVVISKDHKVIVSHEAFMNHEIALDPQGNLITKEKEREHNIYNLSYAALKKYDVGSVAHPRFPEQIKKTEYKPSLDDLIAVIEEKYPKQVKYNIEIKRKPEYDGIYHPVHKTFADLVANCLIKNQIADRCNLQSFDLETLQYIRESYPEIRIALLIEKISSIKMNIEKLGYQPEIYSPHFRLINKEVIDYCKSHEIQLIPWTVNNSRDIRSCIKMGVDGIISDYPDRVVKEWNDLKANDAD